VTGTATVTVNPAIIPHPVANNDGATTNEDTSVSIPVLSNDTPDNSQTGTSVLSVASVTPSVNGGTVTISGTSVIYTPKANFNGSDSFSYTLADGRGGSATATVNIVVTPVNDAPVAVKDIGAVLSNSTVTISVLDNDTDVDGDTLTVSLASPTVTTTLGSATSNGTTVTYIAKAGVTGTDTINYSINDGHGGIATATVTIKITAPVLDVVTNTTAQFIVRSSEWRIAGSGSVPGKTITVRLGTTNTGAIVGSATVDATSAWQVRVKPGIPTNGASSITAWSNGGGKQSAVIVFK
jgi:hypothetical protein